MRKVGKAKAQAAVFQPRYRLQVHCDRKGTWFQSHAPTWREALDEYEEYEADIHVPPWEDEDNGEV